MVSITKPSQLGPGHGMAEQGVQIGYAEECVHEAAVPHIDPRGLHESFLHVRMARREAADEEKPGQQVR